ncbi:hypothetical protein W02_34870 [Nitrospira sp. KM1]|nr:hypothetical protein W02_34870 [Nitrospira sp. KM1]
MNWVGGNEFCLWITGELTTEEDAFRILGQAQYIDQRPIAFSDLLFYRSGSFDAGWALCAREHPASVRSVQFYPTRDAVAPVWP